MSVSTRSHYLHFTRKERRGTLLIVGFISLLVAIPLLLPFILQKETTDPADMGPQLAALQSQQANTKAKSNYTAPDDYKNRPYDDPTYSEHYSNAAKGSLFYFDPNSLDEAGWKKLGMREKTIATILNYRNKGGKFRQAEDIKKIWGLRPGEAERLMPYVKIASPDANSNSRNYSNEFTKAPPKTKTYAMVDINTADTTALIALPGIGSKLSQRILTFRDKLGGFYTAEQVAETYALPDSTFQNIKAYLQVSGSVKKININTAGINELKLHPYIKYPIANAIVQYRNQHGNYNAISDLKKIMIVDDVLYNKVAPYLTVE